jgi:hypothetical protein
MQRVCPPVRQRLFWGLARVFVPTVVEVMKLAVGMCQPDEGRQCVHDGAHLRFAIAQALLDRPLLLLHRPLSRDVAPNAQPVLSPLDEHGRDPGHADEGGAVLAAVQPLAFPGAALLQLRDHLRDTPLVRVALAGILHRGVLADQLTRLVAEQAVLRRVDVDDHTSLVGKAHAFDHAVEKRTVEIRRARTD